MAGINHLYDIYNKKGEKFISELFDSYVTINEKMDGSSFNFERSLDTGEFKFYKRNQSNPITKVDRTISKYYEKPIQYIESLPPHIIEKIPRGWRFGMEYFSNTKPVEISYDHLPKNNLILSYVHEKDDFGKIKRTIQEKESLDTWADLIGIERPPIIFQGKLNSDQKVEILDFLNTPFPSLIEKFKTASFVSFIISVLNKDLEKTALNNDTEKDIEGIVFRFGDDEREEEPVLAKMVDPMFTQIAKEKSKNQRARKPSDFLGLTILDVMNFILESGIDSFKVKGESEDSRYVSFMTDVFVKFVNSNYDKYKGADFQEPEYLKRDEFRLNLDMIKDERATKLMDKDESFESLFKLMLNSFRKIRKRSGGIVTEDIIDQFNQMIKEIDSYIEKPRDGKVNESEGSSIKSFLDFRNENKDIRVDYIMEESDDDEEDIFFSFNEFRTALESIEEYDDSTSNRIKDPKRINLMIGRFQPFHNGHLKMAKKMKERNGFDSYVAVVYPGHNRSGKSPFGEETISKYMDSVKEKNEVISDYYIHRTGYLGNILEKLEEDGYSVELLGCGEDRIADYKKQMEYLRNSSTTDLVNTDFEIYETPRSHSATEVRKSIENSDFSAFKKMTPSGVTSLYDLLGSEIRKESVSESDEFKNLGNIINETMEQIQDLPSFLEGPEDDGKKLEKMMKKIKDFNEFLVNSKAVNKTVNEGDGFGTLPFLLVKKDGVFHYLFNMETVDSKESGFHLSVGKYSEYEPIDGPKNSYAVLNINEVSNEIIENVSMGIGEIPELNKEKIEVLPEVQSRLMETISKCLMNYLEAEPKVTRIYDEMQDNLELVGSDYMEYMKSIVISFLGDEWSVQKGSDNNLVLLLR